MNPKSLSGARMSPARATKPVFQAAVASRTLELYVYDQIGYDWWSDSGVTAQGVADAIKEAGDFDSILLRINSPGGSVFEGSAIYNLLQSQGKPIRVVVDGLAASAAFTIAMVGTSIEIGENAMMMLHNGWSLCIGDGNDMRRQADLLDKINAVMQATYARRSGQTPEAVRTMMDEETWLTPQEAVEKGFADKVMTASEEDAEGAKALAKQMLARSKAHQFAHIPDELKQESGHSPESKPPKAASVSSVSPNAAGCACPCPECIADDCPGCTNADCDFDECDDEDGAAMRVRAQNNRNRLRAVEQRLKAS